MSPHLFLDVNGVTGSRTMMTLMPRFKLGDLLEFLLWVLTALYTVDRHIVRLLKILEKVDIPDPQMR